MNTVSLDPPAGCFTHWTHAAYSNVSTMIALTGTPGNASSLCSLILSLCTTEDEVIKNVENELFI